jgi:hypothetical protein
MSKSPEELLKTFTLYQLDVMYKEVAKHRSDFIKDISLGTRVANHGDADSWSSYYES